MADEFAVYAADVQANIPAAQLSKISQGYANAGWTDYLPCSTLDGSQLAGVLVEATVPLTSSASAAVVSGSDLLDECVSGYEVTNAQAGPTRCRCITRKGVEEAERLFLAPNVSTTFAYPRSSAATFSTTTTRTDNPIFFVPCIGGEAVLIRFNIPAITGVFSANVTQPTVSFKLYAVPTFNKGQSAWNEIITPSLASGKSDIMQWVPAGISPQWVSMIGLVPAASGAVPNAIYAQDETGVILDLDDANVLLAVDTLFPSSPAANQLNTLFNLRGRRPLRLAVTLGSALSAGIDALFVQLAYADTVTPTNTPAPTPVPPSVRETGTPVAAGSGVAPKAAGGARFNAGPNPTVRRTA